MKDGTLGRLIANKLIDLTIDRIGSICWTNTVRNKPLVHNSISNLVNTLRYPIPDSAVVVAAGPSVDRKGLLEKLKSSSFDGIIIACDSALGPCLRNEIIPDIVVSVDPHSRILRWFGDPSLNQDNKNDDDYFHRQDLNNWIANNELKANQEIISLLNKYGTKIKGALATCAASGVPQRCIQSGMEIFWWNPMYDDYDQPNSLTMKVLNEVSVPCLNAGGNVGTAAWVIAHSVLNIKHIALLGMDFSYYKDTPYSRTQYYDRAIEIFSKDQLDDFFIPVFNPYLKDKFYTDPAYFWYREVFLEMSLEAPCITYNCTEGGILFGKNITFTSLEDFLNSSKQ